MKVRVSEWKNNTPPKSHVVPTAGALHRFIIAPLNLSFDYVNPRDVQRRKC